MQRTLQCRQHSDANTSLVQTPFNHSTLPLYNPSSDALEIAEYKGSLRSWMMLTIQMSTPNEAIAEFREHVKAVAKEGQSVVSFMRLDCSMPGMMTVSMQYGLTPSAVKGATARKVADSQEHVCAGAYCDKIATSASRPTPEACAASEEVEDGEVASKHNAEASQQPAEASIKRKRSLNQMSNAKQVELIEKLLMKWREGEIDV